MPELPEVETTRRGIEPWLVGRQVEQLIVRQWRLRWRVPRSLPARIRGATVRSVGRRAKYLLIDTDAGTLIWHLGMSGSLRVLPADSAPLAHDHVDLVLDSGQCLRFNDPRRFGSLLFTTAPPEHHPLLAKLAAGPLSDGVGNIYASEALFRARIRPGLAAGRVSRSRMAALVAAIRDVLGEAIVVGGTTLRDYVDPDGMPGYFGRKLFVYERRGKPCRRCRTPIRQFTQGSRSTYWCPNCQR